MSHLLRQYSRLCAPHIIPKNLCCPSITRRSRNHLTISPISPQRFSGPHLNDGNHIFHRFSSSSSTQPDPIGTALLDLVTYESICAETLEGLCDYFDELIETTDHLKNTDITYSVSAAATIKTKINLTHKNEYSLGRSIDGELGQTAWNLCH